jgi:hypothetical protein
MNSFTPTANITLQPALGGKALRLGIYAVVELVATTSADGFDKGQIELIHNKTPPNLKAPAPSARRYVKFAVGALKKHHSLIPIRHFCYDCPVFGTQKLHVSIWYCLGK